MHRFERWEPREAGSLGKKFSDEFVNVLNSTLLPALVGVGIVEIALERFSDEFVVHEFRPVIGCDRMDFETTEETLSHFSNLGRPFSFEEPGQDITRLSFDENKKGTLFGTPFNEIHFPVAVVSSVID